MHVAILGLRSVVIKMRYRANWHFVNRFWFCIHAQHLIAACEIFFREFFLLTINCVTMTHWAWGVPSLKLSDLLLSDLLWVTFWISIVNQPQPADKSSETSRTVPSQTSRIVWAKCWTICRYLMYNCLYCLKRFICAL